MTMFVQLLHDLNELVFMFTIVDHTYDFIKFYFCLLPPPSIFKQDNFNNQYQYQYLIIITILIVPDFNS